MFSPSARSRSHRRVPRGGRAGTHTHLTLEHLLYALAHDPDGERILAACGADLPQLRRDLDEYLDEHDRAVPARPAEGAGADDGVPPRAADRGAARAERAAGRKCRRATCSRRCCSSRRRTRRSCSPAQGVTRLDVLEYISHGISKVPPSSPAAPRRETPPGDADAGSGERGGGDRRAIRSARTALNLTERAPRRRARSADRPRRRSCSARIEVLCRRRKNNPVFVGDAGVGKTAMAEGLAAAAAAGRRAGGAEGRRGLLARHRRRCSPARASAATSRSASRRSSRRSRKRPKPILFIDEIHSTVGAGATTGGTMDLATLIKPMLTAGELRVIGSTTLRGVQAHREGSRARAPPAEDRDRRAVDRGDRADPRGPARRYEEHHRVTLHRRGARGGGEAGGAAPARLPAARQRDRSARRSRAR